MAENNKNEEEIRRLREYFHKSSDKGDDLKDDKDGNTEKIKRSGSGSKLFHLLDWSKNKLSYLIVFFSYLIVLFLLVIVANNWIIPSIVHDREIVTVPSIEGEKIKEASSILGSSDLYYEITSEQFSSEAEGIILKQIPEPGEKVKSKRPIFITISKGREEIKAPNLAGNSIRRARVKLYNSGLNLGDADYTYSDVVPKDTIISQNIRAGTDLNYGDTIDVIVSRGPEHQVYIPKLTGLPFDGIEEHLEKQGFKLGDVEFIENDTFVPGTIISQYPSPNDLSAKGEYINIVVAK